MATTSGRQTGDTPNPAQALEQLKTALGSADSTATQGIQGLVRVHQARLAQASRTSAALKAQYGADDRRVKTAEASVAATQTTVARLSMVHQQITVPTVQVAANGWALQGRVLDAQLNPAAKFTVFLVDANKAFLPQYGFGYTDDTGYFLLNYAGDSGQVPIKDKASAPTSSAASPQLFVEVVDTDANPVYLSSTPFQPLPGSVTFQNIVLPAGGQPIGEPPQAIRDIAIPGKDAKRRSPKSSKTSKS